MTPVFVVELKVTIEIVLLDLYPDTPAVVGRLLAERKLEQTTHKEATAELTEIAVELCPIRSFACGNGPDHIGKLPAMIGGQPLVSVTAGSTNERLHAGPNAK